MAIAFLVRLGLKTFRRRQQIAVVKMDLKLIEEIFTEERNVCTIGF